MARIRSTHADQWQDEQFVQCSHPGRLLALGIRNYADDNGIFEWKPLTIKMKIFPADNIDVAELLVELTNTQQVCEYETGGKRYGIIRNFTKFQKPKKPSFLHPVPSKLPIGYKLHHEYKGQSTENDSYNSSGSSEPVPNQLSNGTESVPKLTSRLEVGDCSVDKKEKNTKKENPQEQYTEFFCQFWEIFPTQRRGNKNKAFIAWQLAIKRSSPNEILLGTQAYAGSDEVNNGFSKGAAAWLNDDRWTCNYSIKPTGNLAPLKPPRCLENVTVIGGKP